MPHKSPIREYLEHEHAALRALLERADEGGVLDAVVFAELRGRLLRHIAIEEKILLAAAQAVRGAPITRARQVWVEHGAIVSLLVPIPDVALVGELRALLHAHDALEEGEDGVYAECEQILGSAVRVLIEKVRALPPRKDRLATRRRERREVK